jgi:hypothetical protein
VYGQLWIGRAVPRPDAIPRNILDLLNHNYPTVRLAGIDELERLLTVAKDVLYPAASHALTNLLSDGDGTVQRVAASALRRLETERREEKKLLEAQRLERERLETERLEAEHREREEKERLQAKQREQERPEHEPRPLAPGAVAPSTPAAKPESDKPSVETTKVVYQLPPKPVEPEREKPPPSPSGGTGGKSPSKQLIAFLAIAAVLVVVGIIYLASRPTQSSPPQPASASLTVIASPTPVAAPSSSAVAGSPAIFADDSQSKKRLVVGFSTVGAESGWRLANTESIKSEAAKRGIDLRFSDAQQKEENQIKAIRTFIAEGVLS